MSTSAKTSTVVVEVAGQVATIRINRADKRNAVDQSTRLALLRAFDSILGRCTAVVLTGTGSAFCAGVDLKESHAMREAGMTPDPAASWEKVNLAIREHPAIFIAAVNGIALGGGSTLINVCDLAVAAEDAQIGMPEIGFAMYPKLAGPAGQKALSRKRAAWMILTGQRISGRTAESWGMVNICCPAAEVLAQAHALAEQVARFDPFALAESKRALDYIPDVVSDWKQMFDYGEKVNAVIRGGTSAQRAGMSRFFEGERNPGQGQGQA
ncbi:enoyl-CoA hydratase [Bordetella ansorpii]|uniref:Enoyl-CoA hydratase n=1 Tax=Bordetella ansorpii TaxID=288768 RepID=A0A157SIM4_9BORD|nr:enoyl-CoA hydratase/isomerase family protein [Bordetella ansorpii]SAI70257.1 enoyl-CoA hydratase [Bordetella ansorpii]